MDLADLVIRKMGVSFALASTTLGLEEHFVPKDQARTWDPKVSLCRLSLARCNGVFWGCRRALQRLSGVLFGKDQDEGRGLGDEKIVPARFDSEAGRA